MRHLRLGLAFSFLLAACGGGDDGATIDAPMGNPDSPPVQLSCATYCASVMGNCTTANEQFSSMSDCMNSCATWPMGTAADQSGNTLGCRTYHAGAAAGNPGLHCRHAGPGGDGACGANCEGFCTLVLGVCTGGNEVYADTGECMTACGGFATTPAYSSSVQSGDSLACRLYHATAASSSATTHCPHTAEGSGTCA